MYYVDDDKLETSGYFMYAINYMYVHNVYHSSRHYLQLTTVSRLHT